MTHNYQHRDHDSDFEDDLLDAQPWDLADQFTNLFDERDGLTGRTVSAVETRLRSGSVTSTLIELLGVGAITTTELFGVTRNTDDNTSGEV